MLGRGHSDIDIRPFGVATDNEGDALTVHHLYNNLYDDQCADTIDHLIYIFYDVMNFIFGILTKCCSYDVIRSDAKDS